MHSINFKTLNILHYLNLKKSIQNLNRFLTLEVIMSCHVFVTFSITKTNNKQLQQKQAQHNLIIFMLMLMFMSMSMLKSISVFKLEKKTLHKYTSKFEYLLYILHKYASISID